MLARSYPIITNHGTIIRLADVAEFLPAGRGIRAVFMYYVYVIKSQRDGNYYKGRTNNLERRLAEHESGKTQSIRIKRPFRLIHVEIVETLNEARILELYFKSGFGREIIREIDADVAELVYAQP